MALREAVAAEYGFKIARWYSEEQAAHFLNKDLSTMKRWRRKGLLGIHINMGDRAIRYLGLDLANVIILGINAANAARADRWQSIQNENSNSANTGSTSGTAPQPITAAGLKADAQSVLALARQTLNKPGKR